MNAAFSGPAGRRFVAELTGTGARELALVLPGLRYGCERPLLAAAAGLLAARGADIARLNLAYLGDAAFAALPDAAQLAEIAADGRALLAAVPGWGDWARITVVGKSLGTIQMAGMLADKVPAGLRMVWLTPSLTGTGLAGTDLRGVPGFSLIGGRDPSAALARGPDWAGRAEIAHLELAGFDHGWAHESGQEAEGTAQAMAALGGWLDL